MSTWHSAPCVCHRWIYQRPAKITISIIYANYSVPVHLMHFSVFYVRAFFLYIRFNFHCRHQTSEDITKKSDELSTAAIVYFEYNYMVNVGNFFSSSSKHYFIYSNYNITATMQATIISFYFLKPKSFSFSPSASLVCCMSANG